MAPSYSGPGLLAIPIELRLQIYDFILTSTNDRWNQFESYDGSRGYYISHSVPPTHRYKYRGNFGLLSVCHRIRNDVLPLLLGYPHAFDCLQDLCEWIDRAPENLLPLIKSVHVRVASRSLRWMSSSQRRVITQLITGGPDDEAQKWIQTHRELLEDEYDLPADQREGNRSRPSITAQIMDPYLVPLYDLVKGPLFGIPTSSVETASENVIALLWRTFQRLSQVSSLRIVMGGSHPQNPMTHMADQHLLVLMLASALTSLNHLSIVSAPLPWTYFTNFHSLHHLELSGFGPGTPQDAAKALSSLPNLSAITLRWSRASHDTSQDPNTPQNHFLFTGSHVISQLPPLTRFELVCDDRDLIPTYFDAALLTTLHKHHKPTLREFRIDSRPAPDSFRGAMAVSAEAFDAVLALVKGSRIKRLTLRLGLMQGWVRERGSALEGVLPPGLEKCSIFVKAAPTERDGKHVLLHIT